MSSPDTDTHDALVDLIRINAVIATELIQLVENSSRQLRGEIPKSCRNEHAALKKQIVEIAEKYGDGLPMLRKHNLGHP